VARIGISLEAASWRGAFIAGVLQSFLRRGARPDLLSGSSSGACNGAAFIAARHDLLEENWVDLASMPLVDFRRASRKANGGSIFNMSRIFSRALDRGLDAAVAEAIAGSPTEFLVVCTRLVGDDWRTGRWTEGALLRYPCRDSSPGSARSATPLEGVVFNSRGTRCADRRTSSTRAGGSRALPAPARSAATVDGGFVDRTR
jgi:hypothetical protein